MLRRPVLMGTRRDLRRFGRCLEHLYGIYTSAAAVLTPYFRTAKRGSRLRPRRGPGWMTVVPVVAFPLIMGRGREICLM